jgi:hypothetical protein
VSTEEGEVDTELVELDEDVIVWDSVEAWYISTTEDDSRNSL